MFHRQIVGCVPARLSDAALSVRRGFKTHHQAEAVGPAGGAGGQVRVAP